MAAISRETTPSSLSSVEIDVAVRSARMSDVNEA
jgi:hypothetical protein